MKIVSIIATECPEKEVVANPRYVFNSVNQFLRFTGKSKLFDVRMVSQSQAVFLHDGAPSALIDMLTVINFALKKLLLLLLFIPLYSPAQQSLNQLSVEEFRKDFQHLYDSLQINHLNLYHYSSKSQFDSMFREIYDEIPSLKIDQRMVKLKQFVALAGDGHTFIMPSNKAGEFPFESFLFDNKLIIIKSKSDQEILGAELIAINDKPIQEITELIKTIIPKGESDYYIKDKTPTQLQNWENLKGLGIIQGNSAVFTFNKNATSFKRKFSSNSNERQEKWIWAYEKLPLFLKAAEDNNYRISFEAINKEVLYLNFSGYPSWEEFESISNSILDIFLKKNNLGKIVIDTRLNEGGNFMKALRFLLPVFLVNKALNPKVQYYIICGRHTFSAGMSNTVQLRDCLNAIVIGEPTGAIPNGYQENYLFKLPNSNLEFSVSQLFYSFQNNNSNGVQPDIFIKPSFSDYSKGNDPAIEWILKN